MSQSVDNENHKMRMLDKAQGAMIGLALGDALGTTLEFRQKDSYTPITDIVGGGPFDLKPGQWTDDTSMMLCLADSLLAVGDHNAQDQMERYTAWWKYGENSVTGQCFDIGNTVADALTCYESTKVANAGSTDEWSAGNGSLMRLAPIPIFYSSFRSVSEEDAVKAARLSSITTHAEQRAIEACEIMSWLMYRIFADMKGELSKKELFEQLTSYWSHVTIHNDLDQIVQGSFLTKTREQIHGSGFVVHSLEAALWSFAHSDNFKDGALLAANLGDDADTTAAIYGQLAGAFYGYSQLPSSWLDKLAWHDHIQECATLLVLVPTIGKLSTMYQSLATLHEKIPEDRMFEDCIYQVLYEHNCILMGYRWMDYAHRDLIANDLREPHSDVSMLKRSLLEQLSFIEGFQLITAVVRGDRFCDGLWRRFVEDGSLRAWLERMKTFVKNNK